MSNIQAQHPIAVVTRRTGLRADVIRAWERRHRAIKPARTAGNHRLYSDDDIRRLMLIRRAVSAGWKISRVAGLADAEIERMIETTNSIKVPASQDDPSSGPFEPLLRSCLERIGDLDGDGLLRELERASVELGRVQLVEGLLAPLMTRIGGACADGTLRIAHEHLASAAVRSFMESMRGAYPVPETAPVVVVTTPAFQHHELAAVLVAATARSEGWRVTYLGPNLPAEEIAAAVVRPGVRALALSITYGANDPELDEELRKIGRLVPDGVGIAVGGRAALDYRDALEEMGAVRISDLGGFREFLERQRSRP